MAVKDKINSAERHPAKPTRKEVSTKKLKEQTIPLNSVNKLLRAAPPNTHDDSCTCAQPQTVHADPRVHWGPTLTARTPLLLRQATLSFKPPSYQFGSFSRIVHLFVSLHVLVGTVIFLHFPQNLSFLFFISALKNHFEVVIMLHCVFVLQYLQLFLLLFQLSLTWHQDLLQRHHQLLNVADVCLVQSALFGSVLLHFHCTKTVLSIHSLHHAFIERLVNRAAGYSTKERVASVQRCHLSTNERVICER